MFKLKITKQQKAIGILILFCCVLQLLRVQLTQSLFFSFLLWNLFLAVVPYLISEILKKLQLTRIKLIFYLSIWLLFLPNAPYIITDFIHLHHLKSTLIWYDLFMIFCFATTGLLLTIFSMYDIHQLIKVKWKLTTANNAMLIVCFLCGYGIYLGRFLRLNSWYIFSTPLNTFKQSLISFTNQTTWFVSIGFGSLLWIMFLTFQSFLSEEKK